MHPFAHDGGTPPHLAAAGNYGLTYITQQSSPERVAMLLRIPNFQAEPFGTTEWLLNYFGVKDVDYTFNGDGAPVMTDQDRSELTAVWRYITSPAYALFSANRSPRSHTAEEAMIAATETEPTLGLYSPRPPRTSRQPV